MHICYNKNWVHICYHKNWVYICYHKNWVHICWMYCIPGHQSLNYPLMVLSSCDIGLLRLTRIRCRLLHYLTNNSCYRVISTLSFLDWDVNITTISKAFSYTKTTLFWSDFHLTREYPVTYAMLDFFMVILSVPSQITWWSISPCYWSCLNGMGPYWWLNAKET